MLRLLYIALTLGATLFCLPKALAQNAVGLTLGGPTYIHFTHGLGGPEAVEAGVSFSYNHATHIYVDYLLETHSPLRSPTLQDVGLFYGVGGILVIMNEDRHDHRINHDHHDDDGYYGHDDGDIGFGVRLPVGLDWRPAKAQEFSFHIQLVPIVTVVPETELEFNAGIGLKYRF